MEIEYDPAKSAANLKKHGLSLEQAKQLWEVPTVVLRARTVGEERFMIIGRLGHKLYSAIFTKRDETIRLISARRSHGKEERIYHEAFKEKD
jgi:hypothetical protein